MFYLPILFTKLLLDSEWPDNSEQFSFDQKVHYVSPSSTIFTKNLGINKRDLSAVVEFQGQELTEISRFLLTDPSVKVRSQEYFSRIDFQT